MNRGGNMSVKVSEQLNAQNNSAYNKKIWGDLIFNVKVYGAKGDGVTDDTTAVQKTTDACIDAGGGIVYFPPGSYFFAESSGSIDPGIGGYIIEGSGIGSTILLFNEGTSTADITLRKNLFYNNANDANKQTISFRNLSFIGTKSATKYDKGGVPIFLDYYKQINIEECNFEDLSYMAMDCHYNQQFTVRNCRLTNISRDAIRARDTFNVLVTNNYIKGTGDDAIALHTADTTITTFSPVREGILVANNILEDCYSIKVLGGREVTISNNILRRNKLNGITVNASGSFPEGNVPIFNVKIHHNQIIDLLDTDGTQPVYGIQVSQTSEPARGGTLTSGIAPTRANASGTFVYPWNWRNIYTEDLANAVPPLADISIQGNTINRTLPNVSAYSEWGFGQTVGLLGQIINPAIPSDMLRPQIGISVSGAINKATISDNLISSVRTGVSVELSGGIFTVDGLRISGNLTHDIQDRGILINSPVDRSVIGEISNNVLMGDTYRVNSNSAANGSYLANSVPDGILLSKIKGLSVNNNEFSHWCRPIFATYQADNHFFDNVAYAQIAARGFSTSNKGIGQVDSYYEAIRFFHADMDPASATYLQVLNGSPVESPSMPTTGTHLQGIYVKNSNAAILGTAGSRYVVLGWTRLTTGSGNVSGTDWIENRTLTGT